MNRSVTIGDWSAAQRAGLNVRFETVTIDLDPEQFKPLAESILEAIRTGIRSIGTQASRATIKKRLREGIASTTLFNASGRLVDALGLVVNRLGEWGMEWGVTIPADHFGPTFTAGAAERALERLRDLVVALRDPFEIPAVQKALELAVEAMITARRR
jgi:hypothetical protein